MMIGVNGGRFRMGCVSGVACRDSEPVREVVVEPFAMSIHHVTRGDFRRFVEQSGHVTEAERAPKTPAYVHVPDPSYARNCFTGAFNVPRHVPSREPGFNWGFSWRDPGYPQTDDHPVVCVSWVDAQEYVRWLAAETGRPYRLPSEAEWEYAARAGTAQTVLSDAEASEISFCNSLLKKKDSLSSEEIEKCAWRHSRTQAVGAYRPNAFGLHAMTRNAAEWVEDCWHRNFRGAPEDGSAWGSKSCRRNRHVIRPGNLTRLTAPVEGRHDFRKDGSTNLLGFRVALPTSD